MSDIELQLTMALRPRIELAFGLFDNELLAEAGTYLDLPIATVNVTQLSSSHVNANCETTSEAAAGDEADFAAAFTNLTHISGAVDVGAGVDVRMQADVPVLKDPVFVTTWNLASMPATTLPTACLVYQTDAPAGAAFTPAATKMAAMKREKEERGGLGGGPSSGAGAVLCLVERVLACFVLVGVFMC